VRSVRAQAQTGERADDGDSTNTIVSASRIRTPRRFLQSSPLVMLSRSMVTAKSYASKAARSWSANAISSRLYEMKTLSLPSCPAAPAIAPPLQCLKLSRCREVINSKKALERGRAVPNGIRAFRGRGDGAKMEENGKQCPLAAFAMFRWPPRFKRESRFGGEGNFALAMECRLWRGLRSFPRRTRRRASRPTEASKPTVGYVRNTSILLKNSNFRFDHNSEDRWRP
jgi:hypothetical protein